MVRGLFEGAQNSEAGAKCADYSRAQTKQGRGVIEEIRYSKFSFLPHFFFFFRYCADSMLCLHLERSFIVRNILNIICTYVTMTICICAKYETQLHFNFESIRVYFYIELGMSSLSNKWKSSLFFSFFFSY